MNLLVIYVVFITAVFSTAVAENPKTPCKCTPFELEVYRKICYEEKAYPTVCALKKAFDCFETPRGRAAKSDWILVDDESECQLKMPARLQRGASSAHEAAPSGVTVAETSVSETSVFERSFSETSVSETSVPEKGVVDLPVDGPLSAESASDPVTTLKSVPVVDRPASVKKVKNVPVVDGPVDEKPCICAPWEEKWTMKLCYEAKLYPNLCVLKQTFDCWESPRGKRAHAGWRSVLYESDCV